MESEWQQILNDDDDDEKLSIQLAQPLALPTNEHGDNVEQRLMSWEMSSNASQNKP